MVHGDRRTRAHGRRRDRYERTRSEQVPLRWTAPVHLTLAEPSIRASWRRGKAILTPQIAHGEHVLHPAGWSGYQCIHPPGLKQHVTLVGGGSSHGLQSDRYAPTIRGAVQAVSLDRDGRPRPSHRYTSGPLPELRRSFTLVARPDSSIDPPASSW